MAPRTRAAATAAAKKAKARLTLLRAVAKFRTGVVEDPISRNVVAKRNTVVLNKQRYAKNSLRDMVRHETFSANNNPQYRVPHSRRAMTHRELLSLNLGPIAVRNLEHLSHNRRSNTTYSHRANAARPNRTTLRSGRRVTTRPAPYPHPIMWMSGPDYKQLKMTIAAQQQRRN